LTDRVPPNWELLIAECGSAVWATVFRILKHRADAEDCYQQTFLDAFRSSRRGTTQNWRALLLSIATRRAIDRLRERMLIRNHLGVLRASRGTVAGTAELGTGDREQELIESLRSGLAALPDKQAAVFWLRSIEDLSYAEIAAELGLDTNEVGVLLHRARTSLQRHFAVDDTAGRQSR
jgi:RNA polymerase sigma-70 factor (ECF subfamily)